MAYHTSARPQTEDDWQEEPIFDTRPRLDQRRQSSSSVGSRGSRRYSHYDLQRLSQRRSRPPSGASQATSVRESSRARRASGINNTHNDNSNHQHISSQYVGSQHPSPYPGESSRATSTRPNDGRLYLDLDNDNDDDDHNNENDDERAASSARPVRNFSQPYPRGRRPSGANTRDQNLADVSALPPLPPPERMPERMSTTPTTATTAAAAAAAAPQRMSAASKQNFEDAAVAAFRDPPRASFEPLRPYSSRQAEESPPKPPPVPRWLTELYTVSYLIFFALLGTLARLGVQWIAFYPGAPVTTPVVWANMAGSMVMGFLAEDQALFRDRALESVLGGDENVEDGGGESKHPDIDRALLTKHKKTIPLYIGFATGFCGSFTSFSSFARDLFLALSNSLPAPLYHQPYDPVNPISPSSTLGRNGGYSFEAAVAVVLTTIALSLGGLLVGAHLASSLEHASRPIPASLVRVVLDPLAVFLGWGCWLGAVLLAIFPPDRPGGPASSSLSTWATELWRGEVLFALVFAPLGCLLRFYASARLNGLVSAFPLGTFAVNMFGVAVEAACYDIQHVGVGFGLGRLPGGGHVPCQLLQGLQDGFCGCLTTVSTWVAEVNGLSRRHAYFYALATVLASLGLVVIIMGSVRWTVGFADPVCNTGYPSKMLG